MGEDRPLPGARVKAGRAMRRSLFAVLLLAPLQCAWPQAVGLHHMSTYDDNSFSIHDRRADVYHQTFVSLTTDFSTTYSFAQPFYYGAIVLFRTYGERTYNQHRLGAWYSLQLSHRGNDEESDEAAEAATDDGAGEDDSVSTDEESDSTEADDESMDEESDSTEADDESMEDESDSTGTDDESMEEEADSTESDSDSTEEESDPTGTVSDSTHAASDSANPVSDAVKQEADSTATAQTPPHEHPVPPAASATGLPSDSLVVYLYAIPSVSGRFDKPAYAYYDFQAANLNTAVRFPLPLDIMFRPQLEVEYKRYPSFKQFNHIEGIGTLSLNRRIAKGTQLFTALTFGYKTYSETVFDTVFIDPGKGNGKGKGGVKPPKKVISSYYTPASSQATFSVGAEQQVGDGTVSISYLRRTNPKNTARYLDRNVLGATEDDMFDDRYGYQANEVLSTLAFSFWQGLSLAASLSYEARAYPRTAADITGVNLPGDPARADKRTTVELHLSYPIVRRASGEQWIALGAAYRYLRCQSNDVYHDYALNQISLVLQAAFP